MKRAAALFVAWAVVPSLTAAQPPRADPTAVRAAEIRRAVLKHRHFNPHCWCLAVESDTLDIVRKTVTTADIPAVVRLLSDPHDQVQIGAVGLLERLGEDALPALEEAERSKSEVVRRSAWMARLRLSRHSPSPTPGPTARESKEP